ncbi:MAG: dihydrofolate reductase, partial [Bacteroidales bacterium]|nr:dihydrofolate reductase [Bacteroidales bacterium]
NAFDIADKIYLTKVHKPYDGDAFFTKIDESEWTRTSVEEHLESEPPFSYINLERKNHN